MGEVKYTEITISKLRHGYQNPNY